MAASSVPFPASSGVVIVSRSMDGSPIPARPAATTRSTGTARCFAGLTAGIRSVLGTTQRPRRTGLTITQLSGAEWSDPASYSRPVIQAEDGRYAESELNSAAMNLTFKAWLAPTAVTLKTGFKLARNTYDFGNEREAHQYTYVGPLSASQFSAELCESGGPVVRRQ